MWHIEGRRELYSGFWRGNLRKTDFLKTQARMRG
jgi:hypothetical protein